MIVTKAAPPITLPNVIIELTPGEAGRLITALYRAGNTYPQMSNIGACGESLARTLEAQGYRSGF